MSQPKPKRCYVLKQNGVEHVKFERPDGSTFYDPPLPDDGSRFDDRMREMFASRRAPKGFTDSVFQQGFGTLEKQFRGDESGLKMVMEGAKSQGYTPSPHDVYCPSIAKSTGDPVAFVRSKDDVVRACHINGIDCIGDINVQAYREEDHIQPKPKLARDLAERAARSRVRENPDLLGNRTIADLASEIQETHVVKLCDDAD